MAKLGLESWSVCYSLTGGSQGHISAWAGGLGKGTFPESMVKGIECMHTRCGLITECVVKLEMTHAAVRSLGPVCCLNRSGRFLA